jgi:hypothetical protein
MGSRSVCLLPPGSHTESVCQALSGPVTLTSRDRRIRSGRHAARISSERLGAGTQVAGQQRVDEPDGVLIISSELTPLQECVGGVLGG